jgi:hypothetical protein
MSRSRERTVSTRWGKTRIEAFRISMASIAVEPSASYYLSFVALLVSRRIARRKFAPLPADAPAPL